MSTASCRARLKYSKIVGFKVGDASFIADASGTSDPSNEGISSEGSALISFIDVADSIKKSFTKGGTYVLNGDALIHQDKVLEAQLNTNQGVAADPQ